MIDACEERSLVSPLPIIPFLQHDGVTIYNGDARAVLGELPADSVHCCVTSPPYWGLRDYGVEGQLGLERTPDEYVAKMVAVFREVRRVLKSDGVTFLNLGDCYATGGGAVGRCPGGGEQGERFLRMGHINTQPNRMPLPGLKPKDLVGMPWAVALVLRDDGWYLRQDIIWHKPNPMPESVRDRCTKSHEYLFLLAKSQRYYFDQTAIKEPSITGGYARRPYTSEGAWEMDGRPGEQKHDEEPRSCKGSKFNTGKTKAGLLKISDVPWKVRNKRSVWTIATAPYRGAHFATFPPKLIEPCILAGCPEGGTVIDPFLGSGTTARVSQDLGRKCIGIELNQDYCQLAENRFRQRKLAV